MVTEKKTLWLESAWYPVATSAELKTKPISRLLLNQNLVLFRNSSGISALADSCPHRRAPLSQGQVINDGISCPYHGWEFDSSGRCKHIPSLLDNSNSNKIRVKRYAACEQQNLIWVYGKPNIDPAEKPYVIFHYGESDYGTFTLEPFDIEAQLHNCLENFIDVNHTRYLHHGYARIDMLSKVKAQIRTSRQLMEVEYLNEIAPGGKLFKFLTPQGEKLRHIDRLILPSIVQSEYNFGTKYKFLAQDILSPLTENRTRVFSVTTFQTRMPHFLFKLLIAPFARKILNQDKVMLEAQEKNLLKINGNGFCSIESDLFYRFIRSALTDPNLVETGDSIVEFNL